MTSKDGHEFHGPIELRPRMEAEAKLTPLEQEMLAALIAVRDKEHSPEVWEMVNKAIAKAEGGAK